MRRDELIEQGRRTRSAIMDAAAAEFARRDYDATSLAEIAAVLGKPKAALRHHFATKSQLATAVIEAQFALWDADVRAIAALGERGLAPLFALLSLAIDESARSPYTTAVMRLVLGQPSEPVLPERLPFRWPAVVLGYLQQASDDGELPADSSPRDAYALFIDTSVGIYRSPSSRRPASTEGYEPLWRRLLRGLGIADADGLLARSRALRALV
jgi:TetR/AcrR family transcriptional regulator, transcriptional repressor of aconitase